MKIQQEKKYLWPLSYVTAVIVMAVLFSGSSVSAGMFVCRDKNGGKRYTNTPVSEDCTVFRKKKAATFSIGSNKNGRTSKNRWGNYNAFSSYDSQIHHFGKRYKIDPALIKAVIRTESDFNRYAVSRRGAQGLMQLMPATARELNVSDPFNPGQNIEGGTRYLRTLLDIFDGDLSLTLAAYNAGPTLVKKVQRIPRIPETVAYVERVLAYYKGYRNRTAIDAFRGSTIWVRDIVTIQ